MNAITDTKTGLFLASFEIGTAMPGAQLLHLNLAVHTPGETVNGVAHLTQATNPPLDMASELKGQYTYMCVMPKQCHILVTAQGYPHYQMAPERRDRAGDPAQLRAAHGIRGRLEIRHSQLQISGVARGERRPRHPSARRSTGLPPQDGPNGAVTFMPYPDISERVIVFSVILLAH